MLASDPDNGDDVFNDGDIITFTFDMRTDKAMRRENRCPRPVGAARLGPVLVGLLNTFRGDAAG